jgi:hypothetical protein
MNTNENNLSDFQTYILIRNRISHLNFYDLEKIKTQTPRVQILAFSI